MKFNTKLGVVLLVLVICLIALIEATKKENIDWRKTYNPKDKIPYGAYVLKNELRNILPARPSIISVGKSLYTFLEEKEYDSTAMVLFIGPSFMEGKASSKRLLSFVGDGGSAFLAASKFDLDIVRALKIGHQEFNEYEAQVDFKEDSVFFSLANDKQDIVVFDRVEKFSVFNKMNSETTTILGYANKGNVFGPNFIRVKYGKGLVYLHLEPDVFTNYYMLQEKSFPLISRSLRYLDSKQILWYDKLEDIEQKTTPLRFILSDRALSSAWYLLLIALLFYLIFKSKREQRALPVVMPETNLSVAFAKTIGYLYYENGTPGNMVIKKIDYFLFEIRRQYHLDTSNLLDKRFIENLSQRSTIPKEEVEFFFEQIQSIHNQTEFSVADLKTTYELIEQFKQKVILII